MQDIRQDDTLLSNLNILKENKLERESEFYIKNLLKDTKASFTWINNAIELVSKSKNEYRDLFDLFLRTIFAHYSEINIDIESRLTKESLMEKYLLSTEFKQLFKEEKTKRRIISSFRYSVKEKYKPLQELVTSDDVRKFREIYYNTLKKVWLLYRKIERGALLELFDELRKLERIKPFTFILLEESFSSSEYSIKHDIVESNKEIMTSEEEKGYYNGEKEKEKVEKILIKIFSESEEEINSSLRYMFSSKLEEEDKAILYIAYDVLYVISALIDYIDKVYSNKEEIRKSKLMLNKVLNSINDVSPLIGFYLRKIIRLAKLSRSDKLDELEISIKTLKDVMNTVNELVLELEDLDPSIRSAINEMRRRFEIYVKQIQQLK